MQEKTSARVHLINLFRWRSAVALAACLVTVAVSLSAIGWSFLTLPLNEVREMFQWFTIDTNLLTALAALLIVPFAVEGIRRKRLTYPKWLQRIHYAGTLCLILTMVFAVAFISWYDPYIAFGGANLYLHIFCPLAVLVSFLMTESGRPLDARDNLIALVPVAAYAAVYYVNVKVLGRWEDFYRLDAFLPILLSALLMFILAYGIGWLIRLAHNRVLAVRDRKMKAVWGGEPDPVTVRIEIYSLGYHAGLKEDKDDVSVPFDILEEVSRTFGVRLEDLSRAFVKGAVDGIRDKEKKAK